jgi:phospholipid/cholesterol/gamma-HCH transport system permease protein
MGNSEQPELALRAEAGGARRELVASGSWTAQAASRIDDQISALLPVLGGESRLTLDMERLRSFDTYGALLVERLIRDAAQRGVAIETVNMPQRFVGLAQTIEEAQAEAGGFRERPKGMRWTGDFFVSGARAIASIGADLVALANLLGAVTHALVEILRGRAGFRLTSTVYQFDRVAFQAIPIVLLITFLIGAIIAQQGFFHFRKFGADQYVVDMVGILMLREIGVLLVAIMIAGRSGSSYTAELGSMKMREEIDALRTMGLDPVAILILPRLIALVLALPALAFLGSMSALFGGGLVAWLYGDMNPNVFIARLQDAVSLTHFKVGIIKAPFMALVIGLVACVEGLRVRGSAESLGLQTTASVVKSIFLVIVLDGFFAMFFASIGM